LDQGQLSTLKEIIRAMGLPLLVVPEVEADDVIGTLATRAAEQGIATLISTGDKDMAQLVDAHVTLVNTMSDSVLDPAGVKEKFGVPPERIVDYLSLMGDSRRQHPRRAQVRPEDRRKWISEYGSLDGVIANADKIKGKVGEYLRESLDQLPLSRELTTIKRDVALDFGPRDLVPGGAGYRQPARLVRAHRVAASAGDLEQRRRRRPRRGRRSAADASAGLSVILDQPTLDAWIERLAKAELFAFDTETTSLDYMRAEIVGVSFAIEPGEAAYVPLAHDYPARRISSTASRSWPS
jgi:DNA polymerase-1